MKELIEVQRKLKAPKSQYNSFGKYHYRNAEDILEAVKPLLAEAGLVMTISDEIIAVANRVYVKATVTVKSVDGKVVAETSAMAREEETKKGMDAAQITGSASSYARKYALNGMFLIDDTKDADALNDGKSGAASSAKKKEEPKPQDDKKKSRFTPEQTEKVKHLLNDFGAFSESEKEEWRNKLREHKEWTAEQFISMLEKVVDKTSGDDEI